MRSKGGGGGARTGLFLGAGAGAGFGAGVESEEEGGGGGVARTGFLVVMRFQAWVRVGVRARRTQGRATARPIRARLSDRSQWFVRDMLEVVGER